MIEEAVRPELQAPRPPERGRSPHGRAILVLGALGVMAVGVAMRLYRLGELPAGLYHDEAWDGLDALRVLAGAHPLFFPDNTGREPLFIYILAATIRIFGRNPLGVRAASLICGLLTLPATYFLGRTWSSHRIGLLSATILSVTLWHVHLSRVGFRAVALPLFLALGLGWSALAMRRHSRRLAALGGGALGLTLYTYTAARFVPLALLAVALYGLIWHRDRLRGRRGVLLWMAGMALLSAAPLVLYAVCHPAAVFTRSGDVALWNCSGKHGVALIRVCMTSALRTAGMFTWSGDGNWRHNVPHRPIFDPLLSLTFLAGVAIALAHCRARPAWGASLIWIAVMSLPTLLSEQAPHFLRAVGVLPVAVLLPALALDSSARWLSARAEARRDPAGPRAPATTERAIGVIPAAALVGLLAFSAFWTAGDYFGARSTPTLLPSGFDYRGAYLQDARCSYAFQAQLAELARAAQTDGPVYLDQHYWETFAAIRFLVPRTGRLRLFDIDRVPPPVPPPFTLLAWPYGGLESVVRMLPASASIRVTPGPWTRGDLEQPLWRQFVRFTVTPLADTQHERLRPMARFAGGLALLDVDGSANGTGLTLQLRWMGTPARVSAARIRLQALDAGGRVAAQADEPLGTAYYPPKVWTDGSIIGQELVLTGLPSTPSSPRLLLRLYDPTSHQPLPVLAATVPAHGDAILLSTQVKPHASTD